MKTRSIEDSEKGQDEKLERARAGWDGPAFEAAGHGGEEVFTKPRYDGAVQVGCLVESEANPRKRFDPAAMAELEASIREKGVVTPLLVRPLGLHDGAPRYEIAAGHRRFRAARAAGQTTVPAVIRVMADPEFLELLVLENDQREDVHALEEAQGYQSLLRLPGYEVARIAARVGRSPKYIYDRLKLLHLVPAAQKLFLEDRFTAGHAILLARLKPADQERAIDPDGEGLFEGMSSLPFDGNPPDKINPYDKMKAVSVRELEAWIQDTVRFEPAHVDAFLFPQTAEALEAAADDKLGVVLITNEYQAGAEVRGAGKERVLGHRSWKRADGELWKSHEYGAKKERSKTCDWSRMGLIACGPGQGETFRVCINKEKCATHWSSYQKERKKRQAETGGTSAKDSYAKQEARWKAEDAKRKAEAERWRKGLPAILEAVATAVTKAPVKSTGGLARVLLSAVASTQVRAAQVPIGSTSDDLLRHLAYCELVRAADDAWNRDSFSRRVKAFGVDAKAILDKAAPVQTSAKPGKATKGTCRKCSCTEDKACNGGCGWADASQTRCTACFPPKASSAAKKGKKKARR